MMQVNHNVWAHSNFFMEWREISVSWHCVLTSSWVPLIDTVVIYLAFVFNFWWGSKLPCYLQCWCTGVVDYRCLPLLFLFLVFRLIFFCLNMTVEGLKKWYQRSGTQLHTLTGFCLWHCMASLSTTGVFLAQVLCRRDPWANNKIRKEILRRQRKKMAFEMCNLLEKTQDVDLNVTFEG